MSKTYTWRPSGGYYYNTSRTTVAADDNYYYSSNRAFRMDFSALPVEKSTLQIRQAVLNVHIVTAYSATLTIGYSYNTAWSDRKTLLKSKTGIVMGTKTGSKAIDLTEVIQAYCRDGQNGTLRLWAYGTGGSSSLSRIRGYNPSSSYQSQRPYFTLTYDDSKARIFTSGEWKSAVPYVYHNGVWTAANIQVFSNDAWK